jgi:hypothetical protein
MKTKCTDFVEYSLKAASLFYIIKHQHAADTSLLEQSPIVQNIWFANHLSIWQFVFGVRLFYEQESRDKF